MRCIVALAALCLCACAQDTADHNQSQGATVGRLIPPNGDVAPDTLTSAGLGPVRIGSDVRDYLSMPEGAVHHAEANPNNPGCAETSWSVGENGQIGLLSFDGLIARISLHGDVGTTTAEGIAVGDTVAKVLAAYPNAERVSAEYTPLPGHELFVWSDHENYVGLRFEIGEDERVTAIHAGTDLRNDEGCAGA